MVAKTATVNTRLDPDLKREAEAVFAQLHLSPTDAIRIFYRQVALRHGLPFDLCVPNDETAAAIRELDNAGGDHLADCTGEEILDAILRE